jgi:hypothetical protein
MLTGENQFSDSRPGRKVDARGTMPFSDLPPVLVCHVKRFDFSVRTYQRTKLDKRFDVGSERDELGRKGSPVSSDCPLSAWEPSSKKRRRKQNAVQDLTAAWERLLPTAIEAPWDIDESE